MLINGLCKRGKKLLAPFLLDVLPMKGIVSYDGGKILLHLHVLGDKKFALKLFDVLLTKGVFEPFDRRKRKEIVGNHCLNKTLNNVFHLFYLDFDLKDNGEIHVNFDDGDKNASGSSDGNSIIYGTSDGLQGVLSMAGLPKLHQFGETENLKIISTVDLIRYMRKRVKLVEAVPCGEVQIIQEDQPLRTPHDAFAKLTPFSNLRSHVVSRTQPLHASHAKLHQSRDEVYEVLSTLLIIYGGGKIFVGLQVLGEKKFAPQLFDFLPLNAVFKSFDRGREHGSNIRGLYDVGDGVNYFHFMVFGLLFVATLDLTCHLLLLWNYYKELHMSSKITLRTCTI
ncbi:hypothetical protein F2P56_013594 [Juglans regia]|uniref:Uncharacterized protein n=1 Tax=Juglans regia TaxID=51240 RepID=A0A833XP94_JUGRE|nr:hypothetical protein F2P56_013594 [Juglans regia]